MNYNNIINRIKQINPDIKFVGQFDSNNQRTGYWEVYRNGYLYTKGNYYNGKRHGYWEYYNHNNNVWRRGTFINDYLVGNWYFY